MNAPVEGTRLSAQASAQRQMQVLDALKKVLPEHCILFREEDTRPYECDGLSLYRQLPMLVVLPETEAQV